MALKSLEILARPETLDLVQVGSLILKEGLHQLDDPAIVEIRGRGMMWGVELDRGAGSLLSDLLAQGFLFLADGPKGNVLSFTPPFSISTEEMSLAVETVSRLLREKRGD